MKCFLALGSNIGDSISTFEQCYSLLNKKAGRILRTSRNYWTEPEGLESDRPFLNACCEIETDFTPKELLLITQEVEKELGRKTKSEGSYESRIIDIDIITYGNQQVKEVELEIPHPKYFERLFVLVPLQELTTSIEVNGILTNLEELINKIDGITHPKPDLSKN